MKEFLNKLLSRDGKTSYSLKDLNKANARICYWVILPQGVEKHYKSGRSWWSNTLRAKTFKTAKRLAFKYNSPMIDRMIESDLGRWRLKTFVMKDGLSNKTEDEIWEIWRSFPKIDLTKE